MTKQQFFFWEFRGIFTLQTWNIIELVSKLSENVVYKFEFVWKVCCKAIKFSFIAFYFHLRFSYPQIANNEFIIHCFILSALSSLIANQICSTRVTIEACATKRRNFTLLARKKVTPANFVNLLETTASNFFIVHCNFFVPTFSFLRTRKTLSNAAPKRGGFSCFMRGRK